MAARVAGEAGVRGKPGIEEKKASENEEDD
jgi:hypothetical protein